MNQPEHKLQCALIVWWSYRHKAFNLPEFSLFSIPNGSKRNIVTAVKLKLEGVRKGIPDLCLAVPNKSFHGLYIELKAGSNGASKEQKEFLAYANSIGYKAIMCNDWELAARIIEEYLLER